MGGGGANGGLSLSILVLSFANVCMFTAFQDAFVVVKLAE